MLVTKGECATPRQVSALLPDASRRLVCISLFITFSFTSNIKRPWMVDGAEVRAYWIIACLRFIISFLLLSIFFRTMYTYSERNQEDREVAKTIAHVRAIFKTSGR